MRAWGLKEPWERLVALEQIGEGQRTKTGCERSNESLCRAL